MDGRQAWPSTWRGSLLLCYISFHSDVNGVLGLPRTAWRPHVERHHDGAEISRSPLQAGVWQEVHGGWERRAGPTGGVLAPGPSPLGFARDQRLTNPQWRPFIGPSRAIGGDCGVEAVASARCAPRCTVLSGVLIPRLD